MVPGLSYPVFDVASAQAVAPGSTAFLFLDDRTLLARTVVALREAQAVWAEFSRLTRAKTHDGKSQVWARTEAAFVAFEAQGWSPRFQVEVLGVSVGLCGRGISPSETLRFQKAHRLARRLAVLPCSHSFKSSLVSLVLSPLVSWGSLLGGRVPSIAEVSSFRTLARCAVKGYEGGHESVDLQQVLLLGHTSDLLFVSIQRVLKAFHLWRASHPLVPAVRPSGFLSCFSHAVSRLGGVVVGPGVFRFGFFAWDSSSPVGFVSGYAHCLRQFWRLSRARVWLNSQRNDARIARESNLVLTSSLLDRLRQVSLTVDGHARQVMCGGLSTTAHSSAPPNFCFCCSQNVVQSTDHIWWHCPPFSHLRVVPRPSSSCVARLGWGGGGANPNIIRQLGAIRHSFLALKRKEGGARCRSLPMIADPAARGGDCLRVLRSSIDDDDDDEDDETTKRRSTLVQTHENITKCHACHAKRHDNTCLERKGFAASPIDTARPEENQRHETGHVGASKRAFRARLPPIFTLCSFKTDVFLRVFL